MTSGSIEPVAPILVLGVGNILLGDDGFGPQLVELLARRFAGESTIEFVDGGTQGLALLSYLEHRRALLVLDAVASGKRAGEISVLDAERVFAMGRPRATTAHEGNAFELLSTAAILGDLPDCVYVVGVEPARLNTGIGLSPNVYVSLTMAAQRAEDILRGLLQQSAVAGLAAATEEQVSSPAQAS